MKYLLGMHAILKTFLGIGKNLLLTALSKFCTLQTFASEICKNVIQH